MFNGLQPITIVIYSCPPGVLNLASKSSFKLVSLFLTCAYVIFTLIAVFLRAFLGLQQN